MTAEGAIPMVGDRVLIRLEAVKDCTELVFHGVDCPAATGTVDSLIAANGGPRFGHGTTVVLDCPHNHRVALSQAEMQRLGVSD